MYGKLLTALVTPWVEKSEINLLILKSLINHLIRLNTSALLLTASSLDSHTLSNTDKLYLYKEAEKLVDSRTSIYIGLDSKNKIKTLDLLKLLRDHHVSIDGFYIIGTLFNKKDIDRVYNFIKDIKKENNKPMLINLKSNETAPNINKLIKKLDSVKQIEFHGFKVSANDYKKLKNKYKNKYTFYVGDDYLLFEASRFTEKQIVSLSSTIYKKSMDTYYQLLKSGEEQKKNKVIDLYKEKFKELTNKNNVVRLSDRNKRHDEIQLIYKSGYIKYKTKRSLDHVLPLMGVMYGNDKEYYIEKEQEELVNAILFNLGYTYEQEKGFVRVTINSLNDTIFNKVIHIKETYLNDMLKDVNKAIFKNEG